MAPVTSSSPTGFHESEGRIETADAILLYAAGLPTFVVDAPGGGGKIPVMPNYMVSQHENKVVLRNFEGRIVAYEEPQEYTGMCMEDGPCRYCRQARKEQGTQVGVAGLFDDEPGNIALIPQTDPPREESPRVPQEPTQFST